MKNLIALSILSIFASVAQADSLIPRQEVAKMNFGLLDSFESHYNIQVTLDNYGTLKVEKTLFVRNHTIRPTTHTYKKRLDQHNAQNLLAMASQLSDTQLFHQTWGAVCEIIIAGPMRYGLQIREGYDYRSKFYSGQMRRVLAPEGCWVGVTIHPKDEHRRISANQLNYALEVLAREVLNDRSERVTTRE